MPLVLALVILLVLLFGPGLWVRRVLKKYSEPADRYPGTGAELAAHLLARLGLDHVKVEVSEIGDHYDPTDKAVRLSTQHFEGRSLAAVTVAAHEVGHAVQDYDGYSPLRLRTRLAVAAAPMTRISAVMVWIGPLLGLVFRAPALTALSMLIGVVGICSAALLHLVTLPVEWDASFGRALPMLEKGDFLKPEDYRHARTVLKAAALTYVAASLFSLVNVWRWLRLVR